MDYFLLDAVTGELRTARPLDRESLANPAGVLVLSIKVSVILVIWYSVFIYQLSG